MNSKMFNLTLILNVSLKNSTMSPARAETRTTQFRDEPSNHEAKSPTIIKYWK